MTKSRGGVLRQVGTLGSGTVLAAIIGVAFQGLLAAWFGAGAESDAWFWSLSIYAFVGKFLMLTQFKSLSLPVFVRLRDEDPESGRDFVGALRTAVPTTLALLVVALVAGAPWLVDVLAPGLEGESRELTALLLRIRLPALVALGLTTVGLVVVEGTGRFGRAVSAQRLIPALGSLVGLVALGAWLGVIGAAIGALAGGLLGTLAVAGPLRAEGRSIGPAAACRNADLRRTVRGWLTFSTSNAAVFLGEWAFRIGASLLPLGYFSAVAYGRMVHDLAHGALNDAASAVGLTRFSEAARSPEELARTVRRGVGALAGIALPVAVFLALAADRIVALLFGRGAFAQDGLAFVATDALRIFAVGIFLQGINQLLFAGLYANGQGSRVNGVQLVGHLLRAAWLVPLVIALSFRGLVLGQVLMNAAVGLLLLVRIPAAWRSVSGITSAGARLALAGGGSAAAVGYGLTITPGALDLGLAAQVGVLGVAGLGFTTLYIGLALALRAPGAEELRMILARILPGGRVAGLLLPLMLGGSILAGSPAPAASQDSDRDRLAGAAAEIAAEFSGWSSAPIAPDPALRALLRRLEARGLVAVGTSTTDLLPGRRLAWRLAGAGPEGIAALLRLHQRFGGPTVTGELLAGATGGDEATGALLTGELRIASPDLPFYGWVSGWAGPSGIVGSSGGIAPLDGGRISPTRELRGGLGIELGPVILSAARTGVQLGGQEGGSLALDRNATFDQVMVRTTWPIGIPLLGPTDLALGVAPRFDYAAVEDPWFTWLRLDLRPHNSLRIGVSRGIMFGGRFPGGSVPYDPVVYPADDRSAGVGDALRTLAGALNDFDNQVAAIDLRWSLGSLGAPVTLLAEFGLEDTDRSFGDPAFQLGAEALLPDDRTLLRYAYTSFGAGGGWCDDCDRLPVYWYRHVRFQDGWRTRDRLLGHPLGGYGNQHLLGLERYGDGGDFVLVEVSRLDRARWNLLQDDRPGTAWSGRGRLDLPLGGGILFRSAAAFESGSDVTLWRAETGIAIRFRR